MASHQPPSFQSYEDFSRVTLQSLDGFLIILSLDGIIIFVSSHISSLLGHSANFQKCKNWPNSKLTAPGADWTQGSVVMDDIVGKNLLSLIPDEEKSEVFQKICIKRPVSELGKHMEFCCHVKRGNAQLANYIPYEYSKFILNLKDISDNPLSLLSAFLPTRRFIETYNAPVSADDRFYIVGTVCVLRTHILRRLNTTRESSGSSHLVEVLDVESSSLSTCVQFRSTLSGTETLPTASTTASSSLEQIDPVKSQQCESQEPLHETKVVYDASSQTNMSSLENRSVPAASTLQNFELERQVARTDVVDNTGVVKQQVQMNKPSQISSLVATYVSKCEQDLLMMFKKQLEEKTQTLQSNIKNLESALTVVKEQLDTLQDSKFRIRDYFYVQPSTSHDNGSYDSKSSEPVPKKQRIKEKEKSLTDPSETKYVGASHLSHSSNLPKEIKKELCNSSTQTQPTDVPCQSEAEQKPFIPEDKNLGGQKDETKSFAPEDQREQNPLPEAHSSSDEITSYSDSPELSTTCEPEPLFLESPLDYVKLWKKPSDVKSGYVLKVKAWPCKGDDLLLSPTQEEEDEEPSDLQAQNPSEYSPEQIRRLLTSEDSEQEERTDNKSSLAPP